MEVGDGPYQDETKIGKVRIKEIVLCTSDILRTYIFYLTEIQSFWDIGEYSGIGLFLFRNIFDVLFAL